MKRLLSGGCERLFQICRCFRKDERGRLHQEEFTMLEWYQTGWTYAELMRESEELVRHLAGFCAEQGWQELEDFTRAAAQHLARDEPGLFTANMAKSARKGKVYVDYLRNVRGERQACPFRWPGQYESQVLSSVVTPR